MKTVVLLAALAVAQMAHAQTQWKLATGYRAESFHTRNVVQFAQDVERASGGALRIEVHANNTLFKLGEIPQAVQDGKAQAGETIMTSLVQGMPIAGADTVPFLVRSYADARRLWDLQRPLIDGHFAAKGLKALYAVPWPPQGLFSIGPVRSSADFKGTRMRTYNPATVRIAELLGATPVDVPMVEVNKALSAGKLDSMITSALTGVENQVWGQIKQYYGINAWLPKNIVFVNQQAFDALPPRCAPGRDPGGGRGRNTWLGPECRRGRRVGGRAAAQGHQGRARIRRAGHGTQAPGRTLLPRMGAVGGQRGQQDFHSLLLPTLVRLPTPVRWSFSPSVR